MSKELARRLRQTLLHELPHLQALTDERASLKPNGPATWSPKQELGHLVDSAANNHIRFVRAAIVPESDRPGLSFETYAQDAWVELHAYQEMDWLSLIDFWHRCNTFLAGMIEHIPASRLAAYCLVGPAPPVTLEFLIGDYVVHMQHHLDHLLNRPVVTRYPQ